MKLALILSVLLIQSSSAGELSSLFEKLHPDLHLEQLDYPDGATSIELGVSVHITCILFSESALPRKHFDTRKLIVFPVAALVRIREMQEYAH